jgi:hypothetical protein
VTKLGIQNGEHATLEFLSACHCKRNVGSLISAYRSHDLEEMLSVIAGTCSARESNVIASALTFITELLCSSPDKWMEPIECARQPAKRVAGKIVPPNVGKLMKQDRATTI